MGSSWSSNTREKVYENGVRVNSRLFHRMESLLGRQSTNRATKHRHDEFQYLRLVSKILKCGEIRGDRTGTGTLSIFGHQSRFSLRNNTIPVLTTKKIFWRGVVAELLWFISGSTDATVLAKQGVHFWNANASKEFLDKQGLYDREAGDLGPVYGFQWRHFGAKYETKNSAYEGQGVDQLKFVVEAIKKNPNSRRIVLSAWNPVDIPKMAIPPCHCLTQFYVQNGELSCQVYQRSADVGLGLPFNIASYSLLTHLIAHVCNVKAKELIYVCGDTHIYLNHVEQLSQQILLEPMPFPKLRFKKHVQKLDNFTVDDFYLEGYKYHPQIQMPMAV